MNSICLIFPETFFKLFILFLCTRSWDISWSPIHYHLNFHTSVSFPASVGLTTVDTGGFCQSSCLRKNRKSAFNINMGTFSIIQSCVFFFFFLSLATGIFLSPAPTVLYPEMYKCGTVRAHFMELPSEEHQGKWLGSFSTRQSSQEINITKHCTEILDS